MTAARAWITETLGLALFIDNDTRLETHGYGMAEFTAVRVDRVAGPGDSASLRAQVHCGEDLARFASLGCPDTATAIAEFQAAMDADWANWDALCDGDATSPVTETIALTRRLRADTAE